MPTDVLMPQLSPTMTEGRLSNWLKKEGDQVTVGTIIAEVETDKATMEVEAIEDGTLAKIYEKPGSDIAVGTPIAVITVKGETLPNNYKPTSRAAAPAAEEEATPVVEEKPAEKVAAAPAPVAASAPVSAPVTTMPAPVASGLKASPLAKRLAAKWGVPLGALEGTGPHGRIIRRDVEAAYNSGVRAPAGVAGSAVVPMTYGPSLKDELVPHTKMREIIAKRLQQAKQQVPHFYLTVDVNVDKLLDARAQLNNNAPEVDGKPAYKLTVNDFIIKASALALRKHPNANASWTDKGLQKYGSIDISVAVAMEGGLITPILKAADQKGLVALSTEMKQLAATARAGKLQPEQYQGGTFSVSNLGMYGIKHFDAIINPPQAAILACGAAEKRVVVTEDDDVDVATVMCLTMSVDHRVIDGALGAELLSSIKGYLENPLSMLA